MKYKKIMLVSLFLLAILTLGAVSAAEDADGLAAEDVAEEQIDSPAEDVDLIADEEDYNDWDEPEFDPIDKPEGNLPYKTDKNITFTLPEDAQGTIEVSTEKSYDDETDDYILVNPASYPVTNGKAIIPLKDLGIGQHRLYFKYTETSGGYQNEVDDYFEFNECYVYICPVIVPKYVWNGTDLIIKFSTPEGVTGNVSVYRNHIGTYDDGESTYDEKGEWIANATISDGQINLGRFENGYHKIWFVFVNETGDEIYADVLNSYFEFEVISDNPDWNIEPKDFKEVLKAENQQINFDTPDAMEGSFKLFIDDTEVPCSYEGYLLFNASDLSLGEHPFRIEFSGDDYFKPKSVSGSFNVSSWVVKIPVVNYMDDYSLIDIELPEGATGTLTLKVGETVLDTIDDVDDETEYYDNTYHLSLKKLGFGVQEVTVIWNDGKGNVLSRTSTVNSTYVLGVEPEFVMYGEREILIYIPNDATGQVIVGIDGVNYTADRYENPHDGSVFYSVMLHENLAMGKHNVTLTILNDAKYPKLEFKDNFTVKGEIVVPSGTIDKSKDEIILTLPENANGVLSIKIGKYIEASLTWIAEGEAPFENGIARYSLKNLDWGRYMVIVNYTGSDYEVDNISEDDGACFTINPEISYPSKIVEGDSKYITINLPGYKGTLTLNYDFHREVDLVNGKASIPLNMLPAGVNSLYVTFEHVYSVGYDGDTGEPIDQSDSYEYEFDITVQKPVIKASNFNAIYTANSVYKVQITGVDKNFIVGDKVTFKIANKVIGTGTIDKNGYASIKIKQLPGNYKITTVYKKASVTKSLTVKHIVTLKTVKVKKSAKKLVLQATVKVGKKPLAKKKVTFKFNGKTYKATTNKNGIAKYTIKNKVLKKLKVGKKITYQATCLKDTVKKSVKVKK